MANYKFYDRANILLNGQPYLPDGKIRSVTISTNYNSHLVNGFSTDGKPSGALHGNQSSTISWEEYVLDGADYINWNTYLLNNPDAVITVIPFNITSSSVRPHEYTFGTLVVTSDGSNFTGEGTEAVRSLSFACVNLE